MSVDVAPNGFILITYFDENFLDFSCKIDVMMTRIKKYYSIANNTITPAVLGLINRSIRSL